MRRALPLLAALVIPALVGCSGQLCADVDRPARVIDPTGTWLENYECFEPDNSFCEQQSDVVLEVKLLEGDAVEASQPGGTWRIEGLLCGGELNWIGNETFPDGEDNYVETGTWIFADADTFTKTSTYEYSSRDGGGDCVGTGARQPESGAAVPAAPILEEDSVCR